MFLLPVDAGLARCLMMVPTYTTITVSVVAAVIMIMTTRAGEEEFGLRLVTRWIDLMIWRISTPFPRRGEDVVSAGRGVAVVEVRAEHAFCDAD